MSAAPLILALGLAVAQADTVVEVRQGDRLSVENFSGSLTVGTWARGTLEVSVRDGNGRAVVRRSGSTLVIEPLVWRGRERDVDLTLRVPEWMELEVTSREMDISVQGTGGAVHIDNVEGDIEVTGSRGPLSLSTVEGRVEVRDARGRVTVRSQGDDIRLHDVAGEVDVETLSGDLTLVGIDASSVRAESLDGDLEFDGAVHAGGSYEFSLHDGDALVRIPSSAGVQVRVSTFDGEFTSDFPVRLERYAGGGQFEFSLGDASARMTIEVFDGEIRLEERR